MKISEREIIGLNEKNIVLNLYFSLDSFKFEMRVLTAK